MAARAYAMPRPAGNLADPGRVSAVSGGAARARGTALRPASSSWLQRCGTRPCSCTEPEEGTEPHQGPAIHRRGAEGSQSEGPDQAPPSVHRVLAMGGEPLAASVRADFEQRFGHDFSRVRVHVDSAAQVSAKEVNAQAYTVGDHVVFGGAWYRPTAPEGRRLIAHELTHVLQQRSAGPAAGTPGRVSSPDSAEERQAEALAQDVVSGTVGAHASRVVARTGVDESAQGVDELPALAAGPVYRQATIPGSTGGPGGCGDLLQEIVDLLNEVAKRFNDALDDRHDLYKYYRRLQDAHPEHGSWEGHRNRYYSDRDDLRRKLAEWDSRDDCGDLELLPEQERNLREAREFSSKEFPTRPAASMRTAETEPDPDLRRRITEALIRIGVPAFAVGALVVLIIAALADPEPISKLTLIVGSAAAIALLVILGRGSDPAQAGQLASSASSTTSEPTA